MMTNEPGELSERELEILRLVATGASNKDIARQLFISSNTVKVHLRNIFSKISAASRTEAARYAVRIGLVEGRAVQLPADENSSRFETGLQSTDQTSPGQSSDIPTQSPHSLIPRWIWLLVAIALISLVGIGLALARDTTAQNPPTFTSPPPVPPPTKIPRCKELTAMPTARSGLAMVAYENQIYAIGGITIDGITGKVERYDPQTNTWTELSPKPNPVPNVRAAVISGRIYVPGGRSDADSQQPTDLLEIYDPRLDQ